MDFLSIRNTTGSPTTIPHVRAITGTSHWHIFKTAERYCEKTGQFPSRDTGVTHDTQSEDKNAQRMGLV
ncbi:hypothetical protein NA655_01570 [Pseudomonas kuykendallii]|uniref:hypothetical protein n=1 Tax=Pseudomonas kuykendallii TaxID=1007099 RepID=UPI00111376F8|nr:hypothetical protein [Pseudomonas kuykendallii]MCQ4269705.1 hypothetical protein [Pseudomonas kuykendallii]